MIADKSKTYVVSFSGGKDSTALWLHLKCEVQLPNIVAIFCDTGWEHPLTYQYLDYVEERIGPLVRLKHPEVDFVGLAKKKKRFPSAKARFCTEFLKLRPAKKWLEESFESGRLSRADTVQCSGIRHEESPARKAMAEYVETDDYNGLPQWRPIIRWTWQEVFACHDRHGIEPNPLYKMGMSRVGCMPCVMSNHGELREIAVRFPEVFDKIEAAEKEVVRGDGNQSSFFQGVIPARFCSRTYVTPEGVVHKVAMARDVFNYVQLEPVEKKAGGKMEPLFVEPPNEDVTGVCSSIYGLCE